MEEFLKREKQTYDDARNEFEGLSDQERRRRFKEIYFDGLDIESIFPEKDRNEFMKWEEYIRWRNTARTDLHSTYAELMEVPATKGVSFSLDVKDALERLARTQPELSLDKLDLEQKWLVQFHSKELFERCAGLSIVDKSLLPLGILTMLRQRKVTWQMVLWDSASF
jgi:hypothetical protein